MPKNAIFLNPNAVVVGQEHGKPLNLDPNTLQRVQQIAKQHGLFYEGNGADRQYTKGQLEGYHSSWDDHIGNAMKKLPPQFLYTMFANVDANNRVKQLGENPKTTIFNHLLNKQKGTTYQGLPFDKDTLSTFLKSVSEPNYNFHAMSQMPATAENIKLFLKTGEARMWPENWDQYPNPAGKIAKQANDIRDNYLATRPAGVYVAGSGHLVGVQDMLNQQNLSNPDIAKGDGGEVDGITAYHGSPHKFEQFDTSKIGTGEGAQAYGHGLYFAESEPVAEGYRDKLAAQKTSVKQHVLQHAPEMGKIRLDSLLDIKNASQNLNNDPLAAAHEAQSKNTELQKFDAQKIAKIIESHRNEATGHMYEVHIDAHPDHFLDWDKPLSEQSEHVQRILKNLGVTDPNEQGGVSYTQLGKQYGIHNENGDFVPLSKNYAEAVNMAGGDRSRVKKLNAVNPEMQSQILSEAGIHGIRYLDAGSRGDTDQPTHNYVVFDHDRVNIKRRYAEGGEVEAYEDGGEIPNPMSIFPKPQRMFPEDAPVAGGQYLSMPDKTDVTGHKAAVASIGVYPGGKPYFTASRDAVEETGTPGRGSATAKTNLFKQKAGWKWKDAPEGHEDTTTIVSVEHRGKHHYTLNAHFPKGVDLARYENSPTEPRLRPTTRGNVELGPVAGTILVRGREHPVYHHVIVKNAGGEVDGYDNGGSTYEPHKRAEEQGYEIKGYHVTRGSSAGQISSAKRFDPARNMMNEPATFFWDNPKAANEWAHYAAGTPSFDPNEMLDRHVDRVERHETAVMPVRIKKGKHLVVNWDNTTGSPFYDNKRMASILNNARDQGYDTVRIKNMIETGPMSVEDFERGHATGEFPQAHDQIAVLNPAMIRSEFAQFDPERQHENDIGANAGGYIHKGDGGEVERSHFGFGGDTVGAGSGPVRGATGSASAARAAREAPAQQAAPAESRQDMRGYRDMPDDLLQAHLDLNARGRAATEAMQEANRTRMPFGYVGRGAPSEYDIANRERMPNWLVGPPVAPTTFGDNSIVAGGVFTGGAKQQTPVTHYEPTPMQNQIDPQQKIDSTLLQNRIDYATPPLPIARPAPMPAPRPASVTAAPPMPTPRPADINPSFIENLGSAVQDILSVPGKIVSGIGNAFTQQPQQQQPQPQGGNRGRRLVKKLMPDGTYQDVWEEYAHGGVAKYHSNHHNPAIVEYALNKISAPPPALDHSLLVAKRGRPF